MEEEEEAVHIRKGFFINLLKLYSNLNIYWYILFSHLSIYLSIHCFYVNIYLNLFQKELAKQLSEVTLPKFMGLFEKALDQNGGQYLVGSGVSMSTIVHNAL